MNPVGNKHHNGHGTPEYWSWRGVVQRCCDPNVRSYHSYGGRGIKVCERWKHSFPAFLADMGTRPTGSQIERIDNDGDYCPSNCRWATPKQNANNRSTNRKIKFRGVTLTLQQWSERLGMRKNTLHWRIGVKHWSIKRALTTRVRPKRKSKFHVSNT